MCIYTCIHILFIYLIASCIPCGQVMEGISGIKGGGMGKPPGVSSGSLGFSRELLGCCRGSPAFPWASLAGPWGPCGGPREALGAPRRTVEAPETHKVFSGSRWGPGPPWGDFCLLELSAGPFWEVDMLMCHRFWQCVCDVLVFHVLSNPLTGFVLYQSERNA